MYSVRASLVAQLVKNPPAMQETLAPFPGWEDPLEKGKATHSSILETSMVSPWGHKESGRAEQLSLSHSGHWEMATYSSILAWRIPWMEEPGGLQSTGSRRVGHG